MCHDSEGRHDVPEWFKKTGARGTTASVHRDQGMKYWVPDYSDPLYIKYWTRLNAELAARYDGHPDLEFVDCASIGPWGEWSMKPVNPPMWAKAALIDCYTDYFKKTPVLMQFDDIPVPALWRRARHAAGAPTAWATWEGSTGPGATCSTSTRRASSTPGLRTPGRQGPCPFELCWTMEYWDEKGWDAEYIFDQAVKWHVSTFNGKSAPVSESPVARGRPLPQAHGIPVRAAQVSHDARRRAAAR